MAIAADPATVGFWSVVSLSASDRIWRIDPSRSCKSRKNPGSFRNRGLIGSEGRHRTIDTRIMGSAKARRLTRRQWLSYARWCCGYRRLCLRRLLLLAVDPGHAGIGIAIAGIGAVGRKYHKAHGGGFLSQGRVGAAVGAQANASVGTTRLARLTP